MSLGFGLALVPLTAFMKLTSLPNFSWLPFAAVIALVPLGAALNFPSVTALLSRVVDESERGLYMGVQQTYARDGARDLSAHRGRGVRSSR